MPSGNQAVILYLCFDWNSQLNLWSLIAVSNNILWSTPCGMYSIVTVVTDWCPYDSYISFVGKTSHQRVLDTFLSSNKLLACLLFCLYLYVLAYIIQVIRQLNRCSMVPSCGDLQVYNFTFSSGFLYAVLCVLAMREENQVFHSVVSWNTLIKSKMGVILK